MLDGGATQAYLPTHMSDAVAAAFDPPAIYNKTLGFYPVPCDARAPVFAVEIGGVAFPIDKKDMVIDDETGRGTCMSGVNNGNMYAPYVFGGTFMKNVLTVFDVGRSELRFRARKPY
jgi:aspergillopepsin I